MPGNIHIHGPKRMAPKRMAHERAPYLVFFLHVPFVVADAGGQGNACVRKAVGCRATWGFPHIGGTLLGDPSYKGILIGGPYYKGILLFGDPY